MMILPRSLGRIYVARDVLDVLAALEHEHAQTFLSELLGGPSSGNPGPHDYRIVLRLLHQILAVDCVTSSAVSPQRVELSTGDQEYGRGGPGYSRPMRDCKL